MKHLTSILILALIICCSTVSAQTPHLNNSSFILIDPGTGFSLTLLPGTLSANQVLTLPNTTGTLSTGGGTLTLPYSGTVSSASPAFSIANTGSGLAISTSGSLNLSNAADVLMIGGQTILKASNPAGNFSIALGVGASAAGVTNTAVGYSSMQTNIPGTVGNTAIGVTSLASLGSGGGSDYNTAVGREAGYNVENGHASGGRNTFLGADADVPAGAPGAGITGATAVGFQAIVTASNTMQLGSPSLTLVNTSGNITTAGALTAASLKGAAANKYAEQHAVVAGEIAGNTVTINNTAIAGATSVVVATLVSGAGGYVTTASVAANSVVITFNAAPNNTTVVNYIVVNP